MRRTKKRAAPRHTKKRTQRLFRVVYGPASSPYGYTKQTGEVEYAKARAMAERLRQRGGIRFEIVPAETMRRFGRTPGDGSSGPFGEANRRASRKTQLRTRRRARAAR